jgi:hypothetical protein
VAFPNIPAGAWLHGQGDSILTTGTPAGVDAIRAPGGLLDRINLKLTPGGAPLPTTNKAHTSGTSKVAVSGARAQLGKATPGYKQVACTVSGHSGANAQTIFGDLATTFDVMVPLGVNQLVFYLGDGINDAFNIHNGGELLSDFVNWHHQIYTHVLTRFPTALIIDVSCFCLGELHTGNAWGSNVADAEILSVDNAKQSEVALHPANAVYVDYRAPLLAAEIANNPANDIGGHYVFLEGNNVHPTLPSAPTPGMTIMANAVLSTVSVGP